MIKKAWVNKIEFNESGVFLVVSDKLKIGSDIIPITVIESEKMAEAIGFLKNYKFVELIRAAINILEGKE